MIGTYGTEHWMANQYKVFSKKNNRDKNSKKVQTPRLVPRITHEAHKTSSLQLWEMEMADPLGR